RGRAGSQVQELADVRRGAWSRTTSPRNLPPKGRDRDRVRAKGAHAQDPDHQAAPGRLGRGKTVTTVTTRKNQWVRSQGWWWARFLCGPPRPVTVGIGR